MVVRGPEAGELSTTVAIWMGPLGKQAACRSTRPFPKQILHWLHTSKHEQESVYLSLSAFSAHAQLMLSEAAKDHPRAKAQDAAAVSV